MLKHAFKRNTNVCINNGTTNNYTKRHTEGNILPLENGPDPRPVIEHTPSNSLIKPSKNVNQNCRSTKSTRRSKGFSLKALSTKKKRTEIKLEYTGASRSSLSEGTRYSKKFFCKQNLFFGEEVVRKNTAGDEEPQDSTNARPSNIAHKHNRNTLPYLHLTNCKLFLALVFGLVLALMIVIGILMHLSYTSGTIYIYQIGFIDNKVFPIL